jgi:agmatinase
MLPESKEIRAWNERARAAALKVIEAGGETSGDPELEKAQELVNELSEKLNRAVYEETKRLLGSGKIVGLVGGDHSVPLGAFQAIGEKHPGFGILHFDAHSDTRDAYEGFRFSHASIMRNALELIPASKMKKLVQVGIRDVCEEEVEFVAKQGARVQVYYDRDIQRRKFEGVSFGTLAREITSSLPHEVWISFDIDGLDPRFCPHTGTPVAGGLDFAEAVYIISLLVRSGRKIVGFDLNEVAPDPEGKNEWDANVGARMLYKLSAWTLASQSKVKIL